MQWAVGRAGVRRESGSDIVPRQCQAIPQHVSSFTLIFITPAEEEKKEEEKTTELAVFILNGLSVKMQ